VTDVLDRFGKPAEDAEGAPLDVGDTCTPEAIPPGVANTLNQMLRKDVEPGYGGQTAGRAYVPGHQIAGKTGTTQENISVAFVGYTPEITASVMVFNPKEKEDVGGFGGGKGAAIWHDAMAPILDARGSSDFPPSDPAVVRGNTLPVPRCDTVADCQVVLTDAGFFHRVMTVDSDLQDGALVGTSPDRGARAVRGQMIVIRKSNGSGYVEPTPEPTPVPVPTPEPTPEPTEGPAPSGPAGGRSTLPGLPPDSRPDPPNVPNLPPLPR
jgi:membrane peptidoglycan carboxypeptidase